MLIAAWGLCGARVCARLFVRVRRGRWDLDCFVAELSAAPSQSGSSWSRQIAHTCAQPRAVGTRSSLDKGCATSLQFFEIEGHSGVDESGVLVVRARCLER